MKASMEEFWATVLPGSRPGLKKARLPPPDIQVPHLFPLAQWAADLAGDQTHPICMTVPGSPGTRTYLFSQYLHPEWKRTRQGTIDLVQGDPCNWLGPGALKDFSQRILTASLPRECLARNSFRLGVAQDSLLWGLSTLDSLVVTEPLRSRVDHSQHFVSSVFKAIMQARFLAQEGHGDLLQDYLQTLTRWFTREPLTAQDRANLQDAGIPHIAILTETDQIDALCFLLVLAAQNLLLTRVVFGFDCIEDLLLVVEGREYARELYALTKGIEHWLRYGFCPIGLLLGCSSDQNTLTQLRKLHRGLAEVVEGGLAWTQVTVEGTPA